MRASSLLAVAMGAALPAQHEARLHGPRFEVVCHFDDAAAARAALTAAEATWPIASRLYGGRPDAPAERPVIHLYRDPASYIAAEAALTQGRFKRNLAFAHYASRTAHVAVQPRLSDDALARTGLTFQTLRLVIHEAAHLVRYLAFDNYRSHPDWFADGNASWLEEVVLRELGELPELEDAPSFCAKIRSTQRQLDDRSLPSVAELLDDGTGALTFHETYAVRWMLFRFLMAAPQRPAMRRVIDQLETFGADRMTGSRVAAALRHELGEAALATIDRRFAQHVAALSPRWQETARALDTSGEVWTHAAFDQHDAIAWRTGAIGERPFLLSGGVTVLADGPARLGLLLEQPGAGVVRVTFAAAERALTVDRVAAAGGRPDLLRQISLPALRTGRRTQFTARYSTGDALTISVDGRPALTLELPIAGRWGLSAVAGSTGLWHQVRCEPLR